MKNAKQETIADIVAEMRNEGHTGDASCLEWVGAKMIHYADRIEAAARDVLSDAFYKKLTRRYRERMAEK